MFPDGVIDYGQYDAERDYRDLIAPMNWEQMRKLLMLPVEPDLPPNLTHSMRWTVPQPLTAKEKRALPYTGEGLFRREFIQYWDPSS